MKRDSLKPIGSIVAFFALGSAKSARIGTALQLLDSEGPVQEAFVPLARAVKSRCKSHIPNTIPDGAKLFSLTNGTACAKSIVGDPVLNERSGWQAVGEADYALKKAKK